MSKDNKSPVQKAIETVKNVATEALQQAAGAAAGVVATRTAEGVQSMAEQINAPPKPTKRTKVKAKKSGGGSSAKKKPEQTVKKNAKKTAKKKAVKKSKKKRI